MRPGAAQIAAWNETAKHHIIGLTPLFGYENGPGGGEVVVMRRKFDRTVPIQFRNRKKPSNLCLSREPAPNQSTKYSGHYRPSGRKTTYLANDSNGDGGEQAERTLGLPG